MVNPLTTKWSIPIVLTTIAAILLWSLDDSQNAKDDVPGIENTEQPTEVAEGAVKKLPPIQSKTSPKEPSTAPQNNVPPQTPPPVWSETEAFKKYLKIDTARHDIACGTQTTRKVEGNYHWCLSTNDKMHGPYIRRSDSGKVREVGWYKNGKAHGIFTQYGRDGLAKMTTEWHQGHQDGEELSYYNSLKPSRRAQFKKGKRHGRVTDYRPDGSVYAFSHYNNGKRHGRYSIWNEQTNEFITGGCYQNGKALWSSKDSKTVAEKTCLQAIKKPASSPPIERK